ncbi:MAG: FG-GAP-like repeat-containing protein [Saprospiraceae bacterium]
MKHNFTFIFLVIALWVNAQTFDRIEQTSGFDIFHSTQGIATSDYDNDGDLDVFVVSKLDYDAVQPTTWSRLMQNNNDGTFTDVSISAGLHNLYNRDIIGPGQSYGVKMGASWGDYNNDGFSDLFLTNFQGLQLFRNQGNGTFVEVTNQAGFQNANDSCYYTSALWWDFNGDSFLDLYVSRWGFCSQNYYYENVGNGTFIERATQLGIEGSKNYTWMATPIDVNDDGLWDIYLANDFDFNELFVQNPNGTFTEKSVQYALNLDGDDMGTVIGDYNNDGEFDIFISNISENRLLESTGTTYINVANTVRVFNTEWAWSASLTDFDLDGDEDLFVANGYLNDFNIHPNRKYNYLFQNLHIEGQNKFNDISASKGVNEFSNSMCLNAFDYDVDGDIDLIVSNMDDQPYFYENKTTTGDTANEPNWVSFQLKGTISNRDGLGSEVTIWTNGNAQHRFYIGANLHSQSLQGVHFGVGNAPIIDSVEIKWDLGTHQKFYNLPINKYIQLIEGNQATILNLQNNKVYGCTDSNSCTYNPNATVSDGSCTYLPSIPISGNFNSGYLKKEIYNCTETIGSTYFWEVKNGEVVSGQGTATAEVLWHLADSGSISVKEFNTCASEVTTVEVDLSLVEMDSTQSIARLWNEALLYSIRRDFARPTVHARNLFHTSVAMYDAWAIYDDTARTYLIGKTIDGFSSDSVIFTPNISIDSAIDETISFAMFRLLNHRFATSPAFAEMNYLTLMLMNELGYDSNNSSVDYSTGEPAALGNYIAQTIIDFGLQDGSNESQDYANNFYEPVNIPLNTQLSGGVDSIVNPNRWQPLTFETFIDQSGNLIEGNTPDFLSPEWGNVIPFSLTNDVRSINSRNGNMYYVFHEPAQPPYLDTINSTLESDLYKWNFSLVSIWSSHLTPNDSVLWDISPAGIGNINILDMPTDFSDYENFYKTLEGGDIGEGWDENPITAQPYPPQIVPRGDYARVLAEFWADGPDSETPPGHWFTILNKVNDDSLLQKKLEGKGQVLDNLEWDVKSYFILGGTMHDAAISAWSVKGWYDYIRPISALRYMAERGQSSDPSLPNYDVAGILLIENYIELVEVGDPLAGVNNQHVGKIKLYAWRGHPYIIDTEIDAAGVDWILAEDWMPYQRISFVTPPFAGYVSGHSTFSRAAAEAMTLLTGDEFFPGGVGEFIAYKNEFLVFEEGPSVDVVLEWATYRDASDQCSLSRIWGGIHPPADDINGRLMGEQIGIKAFNFAVPYFSLKPIEPEEPQDTVITPPEPQDSVVAPVLFPNPAQPSDIITLGGTTENMTFQVFDMQGRMVRIEFLEFDGEVNATNMKLESVSSGIYIIQADERVWRLLVL